MSTRRLPLLSDVVLPPGVEEMRAQLGGRVGRERFRETGRLVIATTTAGTTPGVVLTGDDSGAFVWVSVNEVRRVPRAQIEHFTGSATERLQLMSETARAFGRIEEGDEVRFADKVGAIHAGRLIEKCRFGALVVREDGVVVGVGFGTLRPLPN